MILFKLYKIRCKKTSVLHDPQVLLVLFYQTKLQQQKKLGSRTTSHTLRDQNMNKINDNNLTTANSDHTVTIWQPNGVQDVDSIGGLKAELFRKEKLLTQIEEKLKWHKDQISATKDLMMRERSNLELGNATNNIITQRYKLNSQINTLKHVISLKRKEEQNVLKEMFEIELKYKSNMLRVRELELTKVQRQKHELEDEIMLKESQMLAIKAEQERRKKSCKTEKYTSTNKKETQSTTKGQSQRKIAAARLAEKNKVDIKNHIKKLQGQKIQLTNEIQNITKKKELSGIIVIKPMRLIQVFGIDPNIFFKEQFEFEKQNKKRAISSEWMNFTQILEGKSSEAVVQWVQCSIQNMESKLQWDKQQLELFFFMFTILPFPLSDLISPVII
ncbi:Protein kinase domain containing protein [Reticulomyxa filosa]|uniref:Protein kinase domain containing protein n=1 Tax=Reticulomyxa filosa TaxID=46433 RepID=X6NCG6_RETFI|nr:Protein kinase domain containing protein [Reticulomyxa filosa]|eukprot:ETO23449.1 Protein kinase domain containing protein [Reticulomyxa filosa]